MIKYFLKRIWDDFWHISEELIFIVLLIIVFGVIALNTYIMYLWLGTVDIALGFLVLLPEIIVIRILFYFKKIYYDYNKEQVYKIIKEARKNGTEWKD